MTLLGQIQLGKQLAQVLPIELPFKRLGCRFPVILKVKEPFGESVEVWEVVRCQNLPLDNGEVDLDLVQPAGMDGSVNEDEVWVATLQALYSPGTAMG